MILFACPNPTCRKQHQATEEAAGAVFECDGSGCGFHVVVPAPSEPGPGSDEEPVALIKDGSADPPPSSESGRPRKATLAEEPAPSRRPGRATLVDEPDPDRRWYDRPRRSGFRCPFCDTDALPWTTTRISTGGWVVFAILLVFFFPLFWVGLLIKEQNRVCRDCGVRLDR